MKSYRFSKKYDKAYAKRIGHNVKLDAKIEQQLALFVAGQRDYPLKDHALTGKLEGKRAFSITGDIRVIYIETAEAIIFIDIGTHNQVHGE